MNSTRIIKIAAVLGAIAVGLGALGAHALKELLTPAQLTSFLTGVRYHMLHVIVLLVVTALRPHFTAKAFTIAVRLFFIGILMFSGSIYLLSLNSLTHLNMGPILGPITPIGGLLLISGWITLAIGAKIKTQL